MRLIYQLFPFFKQTGRYHAKTFLTATTNDICQSVERPNTSGTREGCLGAWSVDSTTHQSGFVVHRVEEWNQK